MDIPEFVTGPPRLREKLNKVIRAVNKFGHIRGDEFIKVNRTPSDFAVSLSITKLQERLRMHSSGVRRAFCKTDAGAATTIVCYLDVDGTGPEITVTCKIAGGGNLNMAIPVLTNGLEIAVWNDNGTWKANQTFQAKEYCDCYIEA